MNEEPTGLASAVAAPRVSSAVNPAGCQSGCEDEHEHDNEGTHRPPSLVLVVVHVFRVNQIEDEHENDNEEE
jgi:hypothetical protein